MDSFLTSVSVCTGIYIAETAIRRFWPRRSSRPASLPLRNQAVSFNRGEFSILLKDGGPNKIATIKAVREVTALGLKEAKDIVDGAGAYTAVAEGLPKDEAVAIAQRFEGIATVEVMERVAWRTESPAE
jgi:hypothetical protein